MISLLYFENVNLHSGFPCGEGGLIRSISVRLVPRQPRKKKEEGEEGGREREREGGRSEWLITIKMAFWTLSSIEDFLAYQARFRKKKR